MCRIIPLSIVLCLLFTKAVVSEEPKLPKPPEGFAWQWCEEARVGLLCPKDWHFKSATKNETQGYFITKQEIRAEEKFETGLSVNVISKVSKKHGLAASDYANKFVREAIREKKNVLKVIAPGELGPAKTFGCRIKDGDSVIHYFLITDDKHDTLYLFLFESPANEWDQAWKSGEQMLKKIYVDFPD